MEQKELASDTDVIKIQSLNIDPQKDSTEDQKVALEKEFMPHKWSSKYQTPEEVLDKYIDFITTESEIARDTVPNKKNLRYGNSKGQRLDIFGVELPDDAPILVYIQGGFWKQISKEMSRFPAVSFHKAGIKTIAVGYNQSRNATLWDIVEQFEDAIIYILKYAQEKGSRGVYLAGHNSGAHLIAKLLDNYEICEGDLFKQLKGIYLISGLYDLRNFCLTPASDVVNLYEIDATSFSPLFSNYAHLQDSNVRFYIFAADEDSPTFKNQARSFYEHLFDVCPTKNMYFEIKDDMDHFDIVKCLTNDKNFLKLLILSDLRKY